MRTLYVDIDGTLVGPGGDLLWDGTARLTEALLAARRAGLAVVPVSGRGQAQVRELCRLLGFPRGIAELGCLHIEGTSTAPLLGAYPFPDEHPIGAMVEGGAVELMAALGLEPHEPWNLGREATFLLRGAADMSIANALLAGAGLGWCTLAENGLLAHPRGPHVYHLAPSGTGKAAGVRHDRQRHGLDRSDVANVGDSAGDLECAAEVAELWLVANADPGLGWPHRTAGCYGLGVAEVIERLVAPGRLVPKDEP